MSKRHGPGYKGAGYAMGGNGLWVKNKLRLVTSLSSRARDASHLSFAEEPRFRFRSVSGWRARQSRGRRRGRGRPAAQKLSELSCETLPETLP